MALPTHKGVAVIEFLIDAGNRFDNLEIEVKKLRALVSTMAEQAATKTETDALRNQVTVMAEQATALAELTEQAATKTETDALRNQVTAMAEQARQVVAVAAESIPEGLSRPCPLCQPIPYSLPFSCCLILNQFGRPTRR